MTPVTAQDEIAGSAACPAQAPSVIYLNNAATSWPKAPGVIEAMARSLSSPPAEAGRGHTEGPDPAEVCRARLAALLGVADPARIALTQNATHALNLAIFGLGLAPGSHVITSVTEHNSVLRPINHLGRRQGLRVTVIGLDGGGGLDLDAFASALAEEPALVALNHASIVPGRENDVGPLFARARAAGATTLLDASQTLGALPVRPTELGADLVAFTGHKALHGPPGTGGLYVAEGIDLAPWLVGGTGVRSDLAYHPEDMPMRLEAGTPNAPALAGLAEALRWHASHGNAHHEVRITMADRLRCALIDTPGIKLFGDPTDTPSTATFSFRIEGWDVEDAGLILEKSFGIACRTGLHCAPLIHEAIGSAPHGTIRFSPSGFTTERDVETAVQAIRQLATCG